MARRMPSRKREERLAQLRAQDGPLCLRCLTLPVEATLDHVNGRKGDHRIENLCILCRSCNVAEGNHARRGKQNREIRPENIKEYRNRAREKAATLGLLNDLQDRPDGGGAFESEGERVKERGGVDRHGWASAEEQASLLMEPNYRLWLYEKVAQGKTVTREQAIDAGAERLHQKVGRGSQQTIERYFRKAISEEGWLEETRDDRGKPGWGFRSDWTPERITEFGRNLHNQAKGYRRES